MPQCDDDDEWDSASSFDDGAEYVSDDDSEMATLPCPYCHREVPEDAPYCPYCEQYISAEDAPAGRKPWWILIGVAICLYLIYRWTV